MAEKVGWIGLGKMGTAMALNLVKAEFRLSVTNRSKTRTQVTEFIAAAEALGQPVIWKDTPAQVASDSTIVFTSLADDAALETVLNGRNGVLSTIAPHSVLVDVSFVSQATIGRIADACSAKLVDLICAPVFGRPEAAQVGRLQVIVAGHPESVARVRPLLGHLGVGVLQVGVDPRAAAVVKTIGNFFVGAIIEMYAEAVALAAKASLPPQVIVELVDRLFGPNGLNFRAYAERVATSNFCDVGARIETGIKDMGIVRALSTEVGSPMPLADLMHNNLIAAANIARAQHVPDVDWTAVAILFRTMAGLEVHLRTPDTTSAADALADRLAASTLAFPQKWAPSDTTLGTE